MIDKTTGKIRIIRDGAKRREKNTSALCTEGRFFITD